MKRRWLALLCLLFFAACKKEITYVLEDADPIQLTISEVINDSSVNLTWTPITRKDVRTVKLIRLTEQIRDGHFEFVNDELVNSDDLKITTFHDEHVPFSYQSSFRIEVTTVKGNLIYSNAVVHTRKNHIFSGFLTDALIDTTKKWIYAFGYEQGQVMVIDYITGTVVHSIHVEPYYGFASLGTFNDEKELYLPTRDGWLEIRDASTLEVKDRIYVAGFFVNSVVSHNDQLFISTTDRSFSGFYNGCLKVYDRATKQMISRGGFYDGSRVILLPGTNTQVAELTMSVSPKKLNSFQFDQDGLLVVENTDPYHGDYFTDPNIFKSFPDGRHVITSSKGTIFDSTLHYERSITDIAINEYYSDFEFSNNGTMVYCSKLFDTQIQAISYPSLQVNKTFSTSLPPKKIFRDGNKLISLCGAFPANTSGSMVPWYFIIETFNLP